MGLTVFLQDENDEILFTADITHNLRSMADAANLRDVLWRPHECCNETTVFAKNIVSNLRDGVISLATIKTTFGEFEPPFQEGTWVDLLLFCSAYLQACKDFPNATVQVSR